MSRKPQFPNTASVLQRIESLRETPLQAIAQRLKRDIDETEASARVGSTPPQCLTALIEMTEGLLARLPMRFDARFFFDAAMIQALSDTWSSVVRLPQTIIPRPGKVWAVHGAAISEDRNNGQRLFFMLIPGSEDLADVDLRTYAFMCHELAHVLLFKDDRSFTERFVPELEKHLRKIQFSAAADKGSARVRARHWMDQIERFWRPTSNHQNWAHELANDVIAVWTAGPSYIDTYLAAVQSEDARPFELVQSHPPHFVRATAMSYAAGRLGWSAHELKVRLDEWQKRFQPSNQYAAAANRDLMLSCTHAALSACEHLKLPKCSTIFIDHVKKLLRRDEVPSLGIEAICASWLKAAERDYDVWEKNTFERMRQFIQ